MDLLEPGCAGRVIGQVRPERLLHLAWYAVPGNFWEAQENVEWARASRELLHAFIQGGGARMAAAGSCAEYDMTAGECVESKTPLLPKTLYGRSKHEAQRALEAAEKPSGLSAAWGRVFFMYGPHENPARPVPYVVRSLLKGEPAVCSEGTQVLDFLHVEDVASALVALLESGVQGPVNIGSGIPVTLREVFETIGTQLGRPELIQFGAREAGAQPYRLWARTRRLSEELGWTPRYSLSSGLENTIEWWRRAVESSMRTARK
jgi:nucleoside-diphosphate-sugar epimerase